MKKEFTLLNEDYIKIDCGDRILYGGSQNLFAGTNELIHNKGCGLIASCDLLIYLGFTPLKRDKIGVGEYMAFVEDYYDNFFTIKKDFDTNALKLVSRLNRFTKHNLKAHWGVNYLCITGLFRGYSNVKRGRRYLNQLDYIKQSLENDIPVIISVGPEVEGAALYTDFNLAPESKISTVFNNHYVALTGAFETENDVILRASSWGQKLYFSYSEYLAKTKTDKGCLIGKNIVNSFSDIVTIALEK